MAKYDSDDTGTCSKFSDTNHISRSIGDMNLPHLLQRISMLTRSRILEISTDGRWTEPIDASRSRMAVE